MNRRTFLTFLSILPLAPVAGMKMESASAVDDAVRRLRFTYASRIALVRRLERIESQLARAYESMHACPVNTYKP